MSIFLYMIIYNCLILPTGFEIDLNMMIKKYIPMHFRQYKNATININIRPTYISQELLDALYFINMNIIIPIITIHFW